MQLSKRVLDEDCSPQYENSGVSQSEAINWFINSDVSQSKFSSTS